MIKDNLHLKAPGNWINDPNGFIFYGGKYHLFYQHFPYAPVWGTMHWGHAVSEDLVHWEHQKIAVVPSKDYDRNGIFSGSAIEIDGSLHLYYTAVKYLREDPENIHLAAEDGIESSQAMLVSKDGESFDNWNGKRQIIPVIKDGETGDPADTRDPKVWRENGLYYMILGSTWRHETGRALLYRSGDGISWEYVSQCRHNGFGRILECPDLFRVNDRYIFAGSPIGVMCDGLEYENQAICTFADFDPESCELQVEDTFQYVDYGLDLYAPQTTADREGRRVMIGWMRMAKTEFSADRGEWNGMMSLPRVVTQKEGHIYFSVHPEVEKIFEKEISVDTVTDFEKPFRIQTVLTGEDILDLGGYRIQIEEDCLVTDRSRVSGGLSGYRMTHCTPPLHGMYGLDIYVDTNLIEIFVNGGQYVLSNVVYGLGGGIHGCTGKIYIANGK